MKTIAKVWTFKSSGGSGTHETLQYTDGSTSCNCPGWTRRVTADGSRTCKHTRMVDQGIAETHCVSSMQYDKVKKQQTTLNYGTQEEQQSVGKLGKRKFA